VINPARVRVGSPGRHFQRVNSGGGNQMGVFADIRGHAELPQDKCGLM
jgi:hypothetical protein